MPNFTELYKRYLWLIILIGLLAVGALAFWLNSEYQASKTAAEIQSGQAASKTNVSEAVTSEKQQANTEVTRRTEDGIREKVIQPKLEAARGKSAGSAQKLNKARSKYANEKTNTANLSNSNADNCRELARLFPDVRFDDCTEK